MSSDFIRPEAIDLLMNLDRQRVAEIAMVVSNHRDLEPVAVAAGIPIYNQAWGGWLTVAGTSVAAPLTALA